MKTPVRSELKQQGCCKGFVSLGRWRPQRECQKAVSLYWQKNNFTVGTFFLFRLRREIA